MQQKQRRYAPTTWPDSRGITGRIRVEWVAEFRGIRTSSSRQAGEKEEKYHWLLKVDPKEGRNQTIMLSNDNLMTPKDIGVFIEANKK